jgi:dTDP-3-amino-3,4,6-trideoxy-alpha-D-glucose transaminase
MTVPFLDVRASYEELAYELKSDFIRVMSAGWYILGDEVDAFESEFARFCGAPHAVGVGNGLDALAIALRASDVGPGDEVIVPAYTFIATWLAVVRTGATIIPVDVDPVTSLIDLSAVTAAFTSRTAAIVPVHLYGHPVDVSSLRSAGGRNSLFVLEDAAQAHGAKLGDRMVGALGDAAGFSFYPTKNLGAFGDGGAITTGDPELATRAKQLRNYGSRTKYEFVESGENSRLDSLQAAFLRTKLRVLREWNARRARVAERYLHELEGLPDLTLPPRPTPGFSPAWHIFCIRHPRRDELRGHLAARGIETIVHYPVPPHLSPAFADLGYRRGSFPVAEAAATTGLSLPLGPHLGHDAVAEVIEAVATFAAGAP